MVKEVVVLYGAKLPGGLIQRRMTHLRREALSVEIEWSSDWKHQSERIQCISF